MSTFDTYETPPPAMTHPRPFYWSVRRELWENRSIYLAPLIVATVVTFALMLGAFGLPKKMRNLDKLPPAKQSVAMSIRMAPAPIMLTTFLVGFFYALDAMYSERRDRSILFWKSLPVSDATTVLSKAAIPLVVLPAIGFLLSVIAVTILMIWATMILLTTGLSPARLWGEYRFFSEPVIMFYGLAAFTLWFAPIYGWLMLISAWAKRAILLWAALPMLAVAAIEKMALNTTYFGNMLKYRFAGAMKEAFTRSDGNINSLSELDPIRFLSAPGLWTGLIVAALCLIAAIRLRRNREPI